MEKHSGRVTHLNMFQCALACQKCVEHGCINQQPLQPWLEDQRSVFEEPDLFEFEVNLEIICWCCNISFQSHVSNIHIWGLFGDGGGV